MKNVKAVTKKQIANEAAEVIIQSLDTIAKKQSKWSKNMTMLTTAYTPY